MSQKDLLIGIALGAGAMYLLDPDRGNRRRALLRDQGAHAANTLEARGRATAKHLRNRARGAAAETRARMTEREVDDPVLEGRVRSELGRAVSNPGAVHVEAHDGCVILSGPVLAEEAGRLLSTVRSVRGVEEVEDRLDLHETAGSISALQGAR